MWVGFCRLEGVFKGIRALCGGKGSILALLMKKILLSDNGILQGTVRVCPGDQQILCIMYDVMNDGISVDRAVGLGAVVSRGESRYGGYAQG
jgi:hypothetical protein